MGDVYVREAGPADCKDLLRVLHWLVDEPPMGDDAMVKTFCERNKLWPALRTFIAVDKECEDEAVFAKRNHIVGTASLLIEPKYIHGGRPVGHIEDVVVTPLYRGQGVGAALVGRCMEESAKAGCYKVVLDCDEQVEGFYRQLGFHRKAHQLRYDFQGDSWASVGTWSQAGSQKTSLGQS